MNGWYRRRLVAAPLLTQSITTAVLFAIGDVTAQQLIECRGLEKHEFSRTARMLFYGGVVFGPSATTWYRFLSRHIVSPNKTAQTVRRVACDQLIFAPTFTGVFLTSMAVLEGVHPVEKLSERYLDALKANYLIWPAVQFFNFKLIPVQYQLLVVNLTSIGWNAFLSLLNNAKTESKSSSRKKRHQVEVNSSSA
ncbi:hypothetical protein BKA56DRAFT_682550 [Ilyonectria sp. MPI-CAGE-AT-0026]|nr:hypothetical protein BKA56DRAFT_682550 [Ilyonectria sp. MPI-CAGE-AT-0026]